MNRAARTQEFTQGFAAAALTPVPEPTEPVVQRPPARKVLFVTPEAAEFVKVGGLGEVASALPRALNSGMEVRVLIPGYRQVVNGRPIELLGHLPGRASIPPARLGRMVAADGMTFYVVLCPELYERPGNPYLDEHGHEWQDADIRFARLSLAAADMACGIGDERWVPDVLHLNDWPAGLAAGYLAWRGSRVSTLLTIHNLAYQGNFPKERLASLGIPDSAFSMEGCEFYNSVSFLKTGLYYAQQLTTVSQTYAHEITQEEHGCGLHGLLADRARDGRLVGILNGIDSSWESHLVQHGQRKSRPYHWKGANADVVRRSFGLAVSRGPLFAIVSRLVHQKGIDLSLATADKIISAGGQIVVTGQGEWRFEQAMLAMAERFPQSVGVRIGFDEQQARQMFAASDFLLMPSRFEPCGLSQMYAQKSGSLPIANKTGGLADTIEDGVSGFLYNARRGEGLSDAIRRAFDTFSSSRRINRMRKQAMAKNYDWSQSARDYHALYRVIA